MTTITRIRPSPSMLALAARIVGRSSFFRVPRLASEHFSVADWRNHVPSHVALGVALEWSAGSGDFDQNFEIVLRKETVNFAQLDTGVKIFTADPPEDKLPAIRVGHTVELGNTTVRKKLSHAVEPLSPVVAEERSNL